MPKQSGMARRLPVFEFILEAGMSVTAETVGHSPALRSENRKTAVRYAAAALIGAGTGAFIWFGLSEASVQIRTSLIVFVLAILCWTMLRLPATPVALCAALALVLLGAVPDTAFYGALGHELIWLLVAAFILAAALRRSGLAERIALAAIA